MALHFQLAFYCCIFFFFTYFFKYLSFIVILWYQLKIQSFFRSIQNMCQITTYFCQFQVRLKRRHHENIRIMNNRSMIDETPQFYFIMYKLYKLRVVWSSASHLFQTRILNEIRSCLNIYVNIHALKIIVLHGFNYF